MRRLVAIAVILLAVNAFAATKLSRDLARKRISELVDSKLVPDAIEIRRITTSNDTEAVAETTITLAFQFRRNEGGNWVVDAVRLGDRDWLDMTELLRAIYHGNPPPVVASLNTSNPRPVSPLDRFHVNSSDFDKQRRMMLDITSSPLVPDAIEVRRVISDNDVRAIVECTVSMGFRFLKSARPTEWRIEAARLGDREWIPTVDLFATLNEGRRGATVAMLKRLAAAIENYRAKNGTLPAAKDVQELNDILHPVYTSELIRVDGWGQTLEYNASGATFRIVSKGGDGRWGTPDDIFFDSSATPRP